MQAKLYARTAVLACLGFIGWGCQGAKKPVAAVVPPPAPAIQAQPTPPPTVSETKPAEARSEDTASPTTSAETVPQASATSDPVTDLITRAEEEYQAGLVNGQAGNNEQAKQNFDNALNSLLGSNVDVRSDARLEKEFDRIVEGVNELYPSGTGETEAQQKSEPAPIDETNGMTPAADAGVKAKAQAEVQSTRSDLPLMMTDQVAGYITYFSNRGRGVFERAFARSGRYHDMIVSTLKQEGVPQDLIYLAQAESGFHPLAVSRVGARGIWQFMGSRAKGYGLSHDMWVDDRQDPEKSTRAAARHLKDLYAQFGDWYLAMAAYNSGPGTVQAAVKRTGYADFWELYRRNVLPKETRNYVPIILAVTIMTKNPSQYGLNDVVMETPTAYDSVTIDYPVDLRLVADCLNTTVSDLQDLNPRLLRLTTPRQGEFELHLPPGRKQEYLTTIASIPPDMRLWWRYHRVQSGETLASLARTYHTTVKAITEANHLEGGEIETEAKVVIPIAPGKHPSNDTATYARRITRYKVRHGDTVDSVAENFGVSAQMLRRWNGIRGDSLRGRKVIALHLPISPNSGDTSGASRASRSKTPAARPKGTQTATAKEPATKSAEIEREEPKQGAVVHHRVKSGETFYSIATAYRTSVEAIKRDNRNIAVLRPGMILTVPIPR